MIKDIDLKGEERMLLTLAVTNVIDNIFPNSDMAEPYKNILEMVSSPNTKTVTLSDAQIECVRFALRKYPNEDYSKAAAYLSKKVTNAPWRSRKYY